MPRSRRGSRRRSAPFRSTSRLRWPAAASLSVVALSGGRRGRCRTVEAPLAEPRRPSPSSLPRRMRQSHRRREWLGAREGRPSSAPPPRASRASFVTPERRRWGGAWRRVAPQTFCFCQVKVRSTSVPIDVSMSQLHHKEFFRKKRKSSLCAVTKRRCAAQLISRSSPRLLVVRLLVLPSSRAAHGLRAATHVPSHHPRRARREGASTGASRRDGKRQIGLPPPFSPPTMPRKEGCTGARACASRGVVGGQRRRERDRERALDMQPNTLPAGLFFWESFI